jgi:hypothetical protein
VHFFHANKLVVSQNTFSYAVKIVPLFPFQNMITDGKISRVRKRWEPGGSFYFDQVSHPYKTTVQL